MNYMKLAIAFEAQANKLREIGLILKGRSPENYEICEKLSQVALDLSDYCVQNADDKRELKKQLKKELRSIERLLEKVS